MSLEVIEQNVSVIDQGVALLGSLPPGAYAAAPHIGEVPMPIGPIGPHFRHCIDFYQCFLGGLPLRVIDYDARLRVAEVEVDRRVAMNVLVESADRLRRVDSADLDCAVEVRLEWASASAESNGSSRSTVHRELQFLLSHTVHHYALVALALRLQGHEVPREFGVSPSTLAHRRKQA